jgi:O-antigen/teichoic acid export membrane protein
MPPNEPAPATPLPERTPEVAVLGQRARRGVIVLVIRTGLVQLIVLGGQVALARLLTPSDFGAFAIIQFALSLLSFIGEAGLGASLIRKKEEPTDTELSSVFMAQMALSVLIIACVGVGARFAGRIWPQLPEGGDWLLRALSGSLLLAALRSIPCVLMERELRFARLGTIDLIMSVTFYVVATGLAWLGWGIWSLATAVLVQGVLATGAAYALRPFRPRLVLDWALLRPIISFSVPFQMNRALGMVNGALAPIYAGAVLGPRVLGLLNWAQSTAYFPLKLVDIISRVAFPLYSRIRDDEKLLGETFGRLVQLCFGFTTFFVALFCGMGEPLIHVVYGDKWLPALPLLHVYAGTIAIGFFVPLLSAVLGATDRPRLLLRASVAWTALAWVLVPIATPLWGALGFAVGYAVHVVVANGALMALTPRLVPHARLHRRLWASTLTVGADYLLARWLLAPHARDVGGFVGCTAALLLFHIGALLLLDRSGVRAALRLIPGAEQFSQR